MRSSVTLSALALLVVACGSNPPDPEARPDAALRLYDDVAWLADDAREGRRAGTAGEREAAFWIAKRMEGLGLTPAGEEAYFQRFEVPMPARDGGESSIGLARAPQVAPLFCAEAGTFRGKPVFCGYGIADAALGRDDFGSVDGSGHIALIVRGVPPYAPGAATGPGALGFGEEEPPDNWGGAGSIFLKVMNAKRRGFGAVLIAQHPDEEEPLPLFDTSREALAGLPALALDAKTADDVCGGSYASRVRELDVSRRVEAPVEVLRQAISVRADVHRERATATNVLGLVQGRDRTRTIIVGAHFDHLGYGGPGSLASGSGAIHNGADDNASGTACVLELARLYAGTQPPVNLLFALWSGEELGLLGSEHWASHPTVPLAGVQTNLNLDMVGRAGDGVLSVLGAGSSPAFAGWMDAVGERARLSLDVSLSGQGLGGSDHQVFLRRAIPALHLFSGVHTDYHKPSDDVEGFEAEGAARVVVLSQALVDRMLSAGELPFVEPEVDTETMGQRERGWSVWFGTVPEYGAEVEGLLLAGTSAGSPAEKAGLLAGDIVVQVGDIEIVTIHDFVYMLQVYKPGDVVLARYLREGEPQEVRMTLSTREVE